VLSWEAFLRKGEDVQAEFVVARIAMLTPAHPCFLSYTSGTTGNPKAVMHSHDSIVYATKAVWKGLLENGDATAVRSGNYVCYLPLSHVAGSLFMFGNVVNTSLGARTVTHFAFPDALQGSIGATLKEVRPSIFVGVPRVWEKLYAPLAAKKGAAPLTSASTLAGAIGLDRCKVGLVGTVRVFRHTFTLEDAIGSHACSLEALASV
jgi:long-chain-fatty-acid--CoA ligase ACSBG